MILDPLLRRYYRYFSKGQGDHSVDGVPIFIEQDFTSDYVEKRRVEAYIDVMETWLPVFPGKDPAAIIVTDSLPDGSVGVYRQSLGVIKIKGTIRDSFERTFVHEMIHHLHYVNNSVKSYTSCLDQDDMFEEVSDYASKSISEGVAELGKYSLVEGKRFNPEIETVFEEQIGIGIDELLERYEHA